MFQWCVHSCEQSTTYTATYICVSVEEQKDISLELSNYRGTLVDSLYINHSSDQDLALLSRKKMTSTVLLSYLGSQGSKFGP